jgi:methionine sulfoxide reductase catalytic subunit
MSQMDKVPEDEITPPETYFNRRNFMRAGILAASTAATAVLYRELNHLPKPRGARAATPSPDLDFNPPNDPKTSATAPQKTPSATDNGFIVTENKTSYEDITHYNNFYEFSTDKDGVADAAAKFDTKDWKVSVEGEISKPRVFDMDDLRKVIKLEERVYRMRCVEGWSMVIPWAGYSLSKLLDSVQPLSSAKYVAFTTLLDAKRMPGQKTSVLKWPYVEGLRMDEAMHPLALLAFGIYGKALPAQDGAPVRLVTPWKYGFKGIKSIVKINLVKEEPPTSWNMAAPNEYGFYANVNPEVDHPRWSQATERRIGESGRRKTLMLNGYAEQVGKLYEGMDLKKNF